MAADRFTTALLGAFALVALGVASVGIFGVFAADIAQRRKEIGVRLALGSGSRRLIGLLLRQALGRAALGVVAGSALALALTRSMTSLLFGVRADDRHDGVWKIYPFQDLRSYQRMNLYLLEFFGT